MKKIFFLFLLIIIIAPLRSEAPNQVDPDISISMKISQWNVVIKALGKLPYDESADIIDGLLNQANAQIQAAKTKNNSAIPDSTKIKQQKKKE